MATIIDFTAAKLRRMIRDADKCSADEYIDLLVDEWQSMLELYVSGQAEITWISGQPHIILPNVRESRVYGAGEAVDEYYDELELVMDDEYYDGGAFDWDDPDDDDDAA